MKKLVASFTDHLTESISIAEKNAFSKKDTKINNVLVLGMGGSGIGGTIASQVLSNEISVPVLSCKDYKIPAFVSENTLIIASSYSGNTEETLSALAESSKKTKNIACVCSGGKIKALAEENNYTCITIPGGLPPRAAFGYSFPQLFVILSGYGLIDWDIRTKFSESISLIKNNSADIINEASEIAQVIKSKLCIIYAESTFEGVCIRFRQQLNENSKKLCWHHVIPEMNHNELVGWRADASNNAVIILRNDTDLARNQKRMELSKEIMLKYNPSIIEIQSKGRSKLDRTLYLIHLCDWISVLIAELNDTDPIEIEVIKYFKGELAKS